MIDQKNKKFVDVIDLDDWEIETDSGWQDIKRIGKTIKYQKWIIKTKTHDLICADEHIVFLSDYTEVYIKDIKAGDLLITQSGNEEVLSVEQTDEFIHMYDLEVDHEDHRYWTNGILSHNTLWMGNLAVQATKMGNNVAIITLEMNDRKYTKRIGANMLNIPISSYNTVAMDTQTMKRKIANIQFDTLQVPGKLWVKEFPTSQASAIDIERYLKKVEETHGIKFKVVVIDYINIIKNWRNPNSENTYMKIKQIAEDLRGMAMTNEWCVISATQTKAGEFDSSDLSLNSASESSGLVATVDGLFGIIQDPIMYSNREYKLKIIANRDDGFKNSYKTFGVNYDYMKITETEDPMHVE